MINLVGSSSKLRVTSTSFSATGYASWVDWDGTTATPGGQGFDLSTGTADAVPAPSGTVVRNVKSVSIVGGLSVGVQAVTGAGSFSVWSGTVQGGQALNYDEGAGWVLGPSSTALYRDKSTADQVLAAALTAVTNGTLNAANMRAGTLLRWLLVLSKSAGALPLTADVRFGNAGTTADTVRLTGFTTSTQTAVADVAEIEVRCLVRSVGAGTAGIVHGEFELQHDLVSTGFAPRQNVLFQTTSAGFDTTSSSLKATLCLTPGAAGTTVHQCICERVE